MVRDVRWSKFVGTGKERNAFFLVSFPFLFFPAHFRAHLYCQLQTVVARSILIGFKHFKILQTRNERELSVAKNRIENKCLMTKISARKVGSTDLRWSKFVGTGKERNAFFPVSFPFPFFPVPFRAHL